MKISFNANSQANKTQNYSNSSKQLGFSATTTRIITNQQGLAQRAFQNMLEHSGDVFVGSKMGKDHIDITHVYNLSKKHNDQFAAFAHGVNMRNPNAKIITDIK